MAEWIAMKWIEMNGGGGGQKCFLARFLARSRSLPTASMDDANYSSPMEDFVIFSHAFKLSWWWWLLPLQSFIRLWISKDDKKERCRDLESSLMNVKMPFKRRTRIMCLLLFVVQVFLQKRNPSANSRYALLDNLKKMDVFLQGHKILFKKI